MVMAAPKATALFALLLYALGQVIFDNISCNLMHYSSSTDLSAPSEALFITLYDSTQLSLLVPKASEASDGDFLFFYQLVTVMG